MDEFWLWFNIGINHILDKNGYDHILYVMTLCVIFSIKEWKQLLYLITAFTIGHSLTLGLSVFNILSVKQLFIELFIPLTIMITCLLNLLKFSINKSQQLTVFNYQIKYYQINYTIALLFGFIHGMGFSYLLKSLLGKEISVVFPLLSFNVGLEIGQLIIVSLMLLISIFLSRFTHIKQTKVVYFISSVILVIAGFLFIQRLNAF